MIDEERKKVLDGLLDECKQMVLDKSWPVSEDELVEHPGIKGSFDFGYLCGSLQQRKKVWHDWKEEPEDDKEVLFVCSEGAFAGKYLCGIKIKAGPFSVNHHPNELGNGKWAYIEELLPIKE